MADEEVDWGMDEPVDEMRQGESVPTGEKEDEISLEGLDGGNEIQRPGSAKTAPSPRGATSSTTRPPPTGPRKPSQSGNEPNPNGGNGGGGGSPPKGPKPARNRGQKRKSMQLSQRIGSGPGQAQGNGSGNGNGSPGGKGQMESTNNAGASNPNGRPHTSTSAPAPTQPASTAPVELEPLPEGWTEVVSRTQKAIFYHNKITGESGWIRPRATPKEEPEVIDDRPTTPPPALAPVATQPNRPASGGRAGSASAAKAPAGPSRPPPSGPGGSKMAPVVADRNAGPAVDPVQSAYAGRRSAVSARADARGPVSGQPKQEDRGMKRSLSPRREEVKRTRLDNPSRPNERQIHALPAPPAGPRLAAEGRRPSPSRSASAVLPDQREPQRVEDRPTSRPNPARGPGPTGRGSNSAPLAVNKWGSRPDGSSTVSTRAPAPLPSPSPAAAPTPAYAPTPLPLSSSLPPNPTRSISTSEDASVRRARLREEMRITEERLKEIREEENRLEREEDEKRRRDDAENDRKRREDDRLREDDDRRRRDEAWRRDNERRDVEDRDRRAYSPRLGPRERSYRPAASPPRGPPPANRLDGPGPPPGLRDVRRARPDSPSRIARRPSPGPYARSPPRDRSRSRSRERSRYANRAPSPPRRNGDSYYPDGERIGERERRGPVVPLADRIGMRPRARTPPPMGRNNDSFRPLPASTYRPLAERMSRADSRDPRDGWMGRDDIAARRM